MTNKSKLKGSNYEREVVNYLKSLGFSAKRAYASNGNSLGMHEEVDVVVESKPNKTFCDLPIKLQLKRRKKFPKVFQLTDNVDASVFKEDKGKSYIVLRFEDFVKRFL